MKISAPKAERRAQLELAYSNQERKD